jgi:hypothetical protein
VTTKTTPSASATPTRRDPYVDLLRAFSLIVVVIWHWAFTVLIWTEDGPTATSPLQFTESASRPLLGVAAYNAPRATAIEKPTTTNPPVHSRSIAYASGSIVSAIIVSKAPAAKAWASPPIRAESPCSRA